MRPMMFARKVARATAAGGAGGAGIPGGDPPGSDGASGGASKASVTDDESKIENGEGTDQGIDPARIAITNASTVR